MFWGHFLPEVSHRRSAVEQLFPTSHLSLHIPNKSDPLFLFPSKISWNSESATYSYDRHSHI